MWSDQQRGWSPPWGAGQTWFKRNGAFYYALFSKGMPDLNYRTPEVRAEMTDAALWWLDRGIDGFRLDAARYLVEDGAGAGMADTPGTHRFWVDFRASMVAKHPEAMLVGEVWEKTSIIVPYFGTPAAPELQMAFDFGEAEAAVKGVAAGQGGQVRSVLCDRLQNWPAWGSAGAFLTNHDQVRSATAMEAAGAAGRALAAAWLLAAPGTPWIYYGEEIGLRNGPSDGDEAKRLPMQWTTAAAAGFTTGTPWMAPVSTAAADTVDGQKADLQSLLSLYRRLIAMRAAHPALRAGTTRVVDVPATSGTPIVLVRAGGGETVVAVFNFDDAPTTVTVPASVLPAATAWKDLLGGGDLKRKASDSLVIGGIEARGFRFLATVPP